MVRRVAPPCRALGGRCFFEHHPDPVSPVLGVKRVAWVGSDLSATWLDMAHQFQLMDSSWGWAICAGGRLAFFLQMLSPDVFCWLLSVPPGSGATHNRQAKVNSQPESDPPLSGVKTRSGWRDSGGPAGRAVRSAAPTSRGPNHRSTHPSPHATTVRCCSICIHQRALRHQRFLQSPISTVHFHGPSWPQPIRNGENSVKRL